MSTQMADAKVDSARAKVQQWGEAISRGVWDWHALGHALVLVHEATDLAPRYQRPWTLLADIYHRIGELDLAAHSLDRSYRLATPGPRHPGGFYKEVASNLATGYPFDSRGGVRRTSPPPWFVTKYQRYWVIDSKFLSGTTQATSPATAFISYARDDEAPAERIREDLDSNGIAVWKDTHELLPGEEWESVIMEAIKSRDFVILCLSRHAVSKVGYYQVELKAAVRWQQYRPASQVFLIPVRLDECTVPPELQKYQHVDLFADWSRGIDRIVTAVTKYHSGGS